MSSTKNISLSGAKHNKKNRSIPWLMTLQLCVSPSVGTDYLWWIHLCPCSIPISWHHNEGHGTSNHQHLDCLLTRLFRRTSKRTSKLRVTGPPEENPPITSELPSKRTSNADKYSFDDVIMQKDSYDLWYISFEKWFLKNANVFLCYIHSLLNDSGDPLLDHGVEYQC